MGKTPEYYAALSEYEKEVMLANATMAFIGGHNDVAVINYHFDFYDGYSEDIDFGMVSSWQNILCWRPIVDGEIIYEIYDEYLDDMVPNIPPSLPTWDDKVILLESCALGDHKRNTYKQVVIEDITYTIPHPNIGQYYSEIFYAGDNNVFNDPEYTGPSFAGWVETGEPSPLPPEWWYKSATDPYFTFIPEEFYNMALFGDIFIGLASELNPDNTEEGSNSDSQHVIVGVNGELRPIVLFDTSKIVPSGKRRVMVVESEVFLFDQSLIQFPVDSYPVDYYDSETEWGWGYTYTYAINLNGNIAVYGLNEVALRLPPETLAIFKNESKYVYGMINLAAFTDMAKNQGGLFYDNDTPINFYYASENNWICSKPCIFHNNSTNREPLLQGGIFREYSANLEGVDGLDGGVTWIDPVYTSGLTYLFQDHSCNHLSQSVGILEFYDSSTMNIHHYRPIEFYNDSEIDASWIRIGAGELAYAEFAGIIDGDWNNPGNWINRYGGDIDSIPTLRTVVRISADVTENNAPEISEESPYPVGARCRSMIINGGIEVDIPVMVFKEEEIFVDHPQNMGFDLI